MELDIPLRGSGPAGLFTVSDTLAVLGMGRTSLFDELRRQRIWPVRIRQRVYFSREELRRFIEDAQASPAEVRDRKRRTSTPHQSTWADARARMDELGRSAKARR